VDFDAFWATIQSELSRATLIRNWTKDSGFVGEDFYAVAGAVSVTCSLPAGSEQHVPKGDFEKVFLLWEAYLKGHIRRPKIRDRTRFSKYIISIMHQFHRGQNGK